MAVLDLVTYPDPRLKQMCEAVDRFDDALCVMVADLEETMRSRPGGVGIAAPQVGRLLRVAVVDTSGKPKHANHGRLVMVNPDILEWKGMAIGREGCMSVPEFTGTVIRAKKIRLQFHDEHGERHEISSAGYEARAIQHELDHLDGLLFLDKLVSRRADLAAREPADS
jgi:peptide deformylase